MQSYGWAECAQVSGSSHLIGTNFSNTYSPFIRYDTSDIVKPTKYNGNLLSEFVVTQGRVGDFLLDADNIPISLTAIIFGRHHIGFGFIDHLQVFQIKPGVSQVHLTTSQPIDLEELSSLFDFSGINIEFSYHLRTSPFRTMSGKIPLLINV